MPYLVEHLMQGRLAPITVCREDKVSTALDRMFEYEYSQLPVIDNDGRPIGMVTHQAILRGQRNFRSQLGELYVREVAVPTQSFNLEDSLFDLLEQLKLTNAVTIIDAGGKLIGIVTSYDSTEYFRSRAEDMMHVEDIETMLKDFIKLAYSKENGEVDEVLLADIVSSTTQKGNASENSKPRKFEDLSLGDYISILVSKKAWNRFEPIITSSREVVNRILEDVRQTRNDLAHFRKDISAQQTDQLRQCSAWLAQFRDEYEQKKAQELFERLAKAHTSSAQLTSVVKEELSTHSTSPSPQTLSPLSSEFTSVTTPVFAEESQPTDSRYALLAAWLSGQPGERDEVRLSFQDIEQIIEGSLPPSAFAHRAWWSNDFESHPQSRVWLDAGWRTSYINMSEKQVTFQRIREREMAYIDFFAKLLDELRKKKGLAVRDTSPDGTSWVVCQSVAADGPNVAHFNFSFSRGKRFRVELYLDTNNQVTTKQIFDRIAQHRDTLESKLGELAWERIDEKRGSRVAKYHPGDINDDPEKLAALRKWAVDTMIVFYTAVEPVAKHAINEVMKS